MYYYRQCTYCSRVFYTYNKYPQYAAQALFRAIKDHLIQYDEDRLEYKMDEHPYYEERQMEQEMTSSQYPPKGGYQVTS